MEFTYKDTVFRENDGVKAKGGVFGFIYDIHNNGMDKIVFSIVSNDMMFEGNGAKKDNYLFSYKCVISPNGEPISNDFPKDLEKVDDDIINQPLMIM